MRTDGATVFAGDAWQVIVAVTGAFGGGSEVGAADPEDGVLDVAVLPAGSRARARRGAPGGCGAARSPSSAASSTTAARVIEVDLPPGTEFNVDGEIRDRGLERVTVERAAYALVVPG